MGKKMSKDKMPEAGEVWQWNGVKIFITCVLGDEELGAISFMDNVDRHHCTDSFDSFSQKIRAGVMTYLGKSKVNINDLFKTENE